jgi:glycosyltransferase involved in cell wall biosynthesis
MRELCVIGYPSRVGGADTELDHQIRVWQTLGLRVHLIPTGPLDEHLRAMRMEDRGCVVHPPGEWEACRGMHVLSYCNGEFLKQLEPIKRFAKTATFVNCMTWLFDAEKELHRRGLIDAFLYQTDHARERVQGELIALNPDFRWFKVRPYFHVDDFPFHADRPEDRFRFARVSREDPGKYHPAQLWVYETMVAPVLKEGIMLGVNDHIREKIGREPNWITAYPAGGRPVQEVYRGAHCVIQMSETYENLPRVGFEAMASGCLLIVDDRGGWREEVAHGQTGFLCRDQREFVYYASRAAFERTERRMMTAQARQWLEDRWGLEQAKQGWSEFFTWLERW